MGNIAGLMSQSKYSHNIIRTGDIMTGAPFTVLNSETADTIIQLPLPINLASNTSMDWQQEQIGKMRSHLMHNKAATQDFLQGARNYKDILDTGIANVIDESSDDVKALVARSMKSRSKIGGGKIAENPRNEMMFSGMQFKSYSFNFILVPYRKQDSDSIQQAIKEFQKASAPELRGQRMIMEYPQTWFIKFMSGDGDSGNEYLMKINECCCTGISVNYTPNSDSSNMHEGNAPLAVELTLDFTEIFIPTKENIDEGFYG